jgi:hypothetical protein
MPPKHASDCAAEGGAERARSQNASGTKKTQSGQPIDLIGFSSFAFAVAEPKAEQSARGSQNASGTKKTQSGQPIDLIGFSAFAVAEPKAEQSAQEARTRAERRKRNQVNPLT